MFLMKVWHVASFFEQYLKRNFSLFLLSSEMYPREPISNGISFTSALVMSVIRWEYFSFFLEFAADMLVSNGTVSSKTRSSFVCLSWMTISGRSGVTQ